MIFTLSRVNTQALAKVQLFAAAWWPFESRGILGQHESQAWRELISNPFKHRKPIQTSVPASGADHRSMHYYKLAWRQP